MVQTDRHTEHASRDRLSTAAFVLGLISALTGVVYFVAIPLGLAGLVLGVLALRRPRNVRRLALGGTLLSIVGLVVALGLVAFLVATRDDPPEVTSTVIDGIESSSRDTEHPPQRDLSPDVACQVEIGALRASGTVTNHTDEIVTYQVLTEWDNQGQRVAQTTAIVESVEPGGTRNWEVTAVGDGDSATTCRVARVDRTPI
jgi:hypothetical protein